MIEHYFTKLEIIIQSFPNIQSYSVTKKVYNSKQGFINGTVVFDNNFRLDFVEVKNTDLQSKIKYRYQYMDENLAMVFRYDNAPHHKTAKTFPHHKHVANKIYDSKEVDLLMVLLECSKQGIK